MHPRPQKSVALTMPQKLPSSLPPNHKPLSPLHSKTTATKTSSIVLHHLHTFNIDLAQTYTPWRAEMVQPFEAHVKA